MKEIRLSAWVLATLLTGAATSAQAAVPTTSAIEGVLMSSGGGPAADGNYTVSVSIYGAETGGSAVWTESGVTIAAKGGQFSYQIGSKTPLSAAALSLSTAWIGVQIGTDPELPRKPLGAAPFALRAAIAEGLECTGCLKAGNLDAGVLQPYAKAADLGAYAKTADLSAYAKASDLGAYAKTSDLSSYAKSADLGDYVKAASLAKVAGTGSYNDLKDLPTLAKVATSGSYADLTNKPVMAKIDSACGTNLVMKGIKADGSYECASAGIAADMINEVSNDLIWNQFVDKTDGTKDVQIKDGFSAGVTDTLAFPDIGVAQKIWVEFNAGNSDVSKLTVELYGPGMTTPYILYKGSKTGTTLVAKYNDADKVDTGDMDKDWLGKNIKGNWSITVKDTLAISVPPGTPPFVFDGKFNWSVNIQTLSSKKIQIKGDLIVDGATTATSGLKIGSPTTTCDASNVGMLRYTAGVNGLEACTVSPTLSAGNAYKWMVARPKPIIWSGGCTSHGQGGSWNTYCLNASDNNTASDYLSIDPGGTVTVKRAGWYRINWFGIANQANWAHVRIVKNGWDYIHYGHNHSFNTWQDQSVDMMWPFKEGEWFRVDIHNSGGNNYAYHSYNLGSNYRGAHSSVQFEFVGPM
jgi:hypothetical protein